MSIIKKSFLILLVFLLLILAYIYNFINTGYPSYSGTLKLNNLKNQVEVYFDNFGIPHIYANNEVDAYRSLGYIQAQERLFQLEMIRRIMTGRLSEILGDEYIELDYFFKSLNTSEIAKKSSEAYLNDTMFAYQKATLAYIDGINQYINSPNIPLEFKLLKIPKEPFSSKDIYLISGYMAFGFSFGFKVDPVLESIYQKHGKTYIESLYLDGFKDEYILPKRNNSKQEFSKLNASLLNIINRIPMGLWEGSNSWLIGPQLSKSGKVIFANDPHIKHSQPSIWYESHLEYPGHSFYGNFLVGIPFGVIGHTNFNAWGMTVFPYDNVYFYIEQFNPEENKYFYNGNWVLANVRNDTIKIKGGSDSIIKLKSTIHGPIIEINELSFSNNKKISVWWNYLKGLKRIVKPLYDLQHVNSFKNVTEIASTVNALGINLMYADSSQNIAWYVCGELPIRKDSVNNKLFLDGTSSKHEPLGYYNFSDNPKCENPSWGYLYSANNQPDTFNNIWHNGYFYPGYRGERIESLIEKEKKWTIEKTKKMQLDDISTYYPKDIKVMLSFLDQSKFTSSHKEIFELLMLWNGNHNKKSIEPTIFNKFYYKVLEYLFLDELTEEEFEILLFAPIIKRSFSKILRDKNNPWWTNKKNSLYSSRESIINKAFLESIIELEIQFGRDFNNWLWEKAISVEFKHPFGNKKILKNLFNIGPYKLSGGNDVLNKQQFILKKSGEYEVVSGPSARIILDFSDIKNSISILPSGQSGHPLSSHYSDQTIMYLNGTYRKQMMDKEEIISTSKNKITFTKK